MKLVNKVVVTAKDVKFEDGSIEEKGKKIIVSSSNEMYFKYFLGKDYFLY